MRGALVGLLIVVSAVVILNQINPQLTQSSLFLSPATRAPAAGTAATVGGGAGLPAPAGTVQANNTQSCTTVTNPSTQAQSYDCTPQQSACVASGGRAFPGTNSLGMEVASSINCSYGTEVVTACDSVPGATAIDPPTYSCITQQSSCTSRGGTATVNSQGTGVTCTMPFSSAYQRN